MRSTRACHRYRNQAVKAKVPFWWYGGGPSLVPALLEPVALLWRLATWLRWRLARPYRSGLPVICIGNLTAGGAGKTPAAIATALMLKARGERPVFLTRGYGGRIAGPHLVDPDRDRAADTGDEPLLLARHAPTVVCADRAAGARHAEGLDASVIVMDDGLQHPGLAKDLAIVVVDRARGIGNGQVIPAGPLRASVASQLARAHGVLMVGHGGEGEEVVANAQARGLPLFEAHVRPADDTDWLKGTAVVAFAGIADPEKFFRTLEQAGAQLVERVGFPDHHVLTECDASALLAAGAQTGAKLVTTEKDAVRLESDEGAVAALQEAAQPLPVSLHVTEAQRFETLLTQALTARRAEGMTKG